MNETAEKPIFGPESPSLDPKNPPGVKLWRSIAKAISWRTVGTIDTLVLSFLLITYVGPLFGLAPGQGEALETASLIAITEVATKMVFYFVHERLWVARKWGISVVDNKRVESMSRTSVKTATWRFIASLDTFVLALIYTGNVATAASIGGLEIVSKMILYFIHERAWAKLPFGIIVLPKQDPTRP